MQSIIVENRVAIAILELAERLMSQSRNIAAICKDETQQRWNMADSRVNDPSTLEPPLFIPETSLLEPLAPGAHGEEGALAGRSLAVTAVIVISSSSNSSSSSSSSSSSNSSRS
jgi:hypothetical protein